MSESSLDIVFCVDNTGSMSSYIQQVQQNIRNIVEQIVKAEKANVRFGLVHYRDHKDDYVVKSHPFTEDLDKMRTYVNQMAASGGGDGPEAVAAGFGELNKLDWRKFSTKIAVFIADAPPHGIEPTGDDYPNGDPNGIDPIAEVKALITKEVMIYSVGCEPAINSFVNARSFMKAVADMTGGKYLSLAQANILSDIIIYGAREEINLDKFADQIEKEVNNVQKANPTMAVGSVYAMATSNLQNRGMVTQQMQVDEVVDKSAFFNASIFTKASNLKEAKSQLPQSAPMQFQQQMAYPSPSSYGYGAPSPFGGPSAYGAPPPSAYPMASFSPSFASSPALSPSPSPFSASAAPPPVYASAPSPSYGMPQTQQAQMNVSPISMEQVQRLYERKQNSKQG